MPIALPQSSQRVQSKFFFNAKAQRRKDAKNARSSLYAFALKKNLLCTLCELCGKFLLALVLFSQPLLYGHDPQLLKQHDVPRIVQQILKQSYGSKTSSNDKINEALLQTALKGYINKFDPDRTYLLAEEVAPYLNLSLEKQKQLLIDYRRTNFAVFEDLNKVIQKAILRAQTYRKTLLQSPEILWQRISESKRSKAESKRSKAESNSFATTNAELQKHVQNHIFSFLSRQTEITEKSLERATLLFDKESYSHEVEYSNRDTKGNFLPTSQQENLFVIHLLKAISSAVDAHTRVLNPREAEKLRRRLMQSVYGIGIQIRKRGDEVWISGLIENSPAKRDGKIQVNDHILEINGSSTAGESLDQIMEWLQAVDTISLVLKREGEESTYKVTLKRELLPINEDRIEFSYEPFQDGIIGKIVIHYFYQGENGITTENHLRLAFEKLQKAGKLKGVVLDLRDNPGGILNQAVEVAGLFIKTGVVVIAKYFDGQAKIYRDTNLEDLWNGPLVVLTSRRTASAAEIVAQALQDYGVAIIVGDERSYGKGSIQSQNVSDSKKSSAFFTVTTVGEYYTVSGRTPQLKGVISDILVPSSLYNQPIGEAFLTNPLPSGNIPSAYGDRAEEVAPELRFWYIKNYVPHIEQYSTRWRSMLPTLRKKSAARLKNNTAYIRMLQQPPNFTDSDPQMKEAVQIVEDIILLEESTTLDKRN